MLHYKIHYSWKLPYIIAFHAFVITLHLLYGYMKSQLYSFCSFNMVYFSNEYFEILTYSHKLLCSISFITLVKKKTLHIYVHNQSLAICLLLQMSVLWLVKGITQRRRARTLVSITSWWVFSAHIGHWTLIVLSWSSATVKKWNYQWNTSYTLTQLESFQGHSI